MQSLSFQRQPQLVELIDAIASQLAPVLFPPQALAGLRSLTAKLPRISPLLFEIGMLATNLDLDLSLPLPQNFDRSRSDWLCSPWERIIALHTATQTGGKFAGAIANHVFWCEFDYDQMFNPIPIPGVFLDIATDLENAHNHTYLAELICQAVAILRGEIVPYSIQQRLESSLENLPPGVHCTHFGVMLSRLSHQNALASSIRVNFGGWQVADLPRWLETVDCQTVAGAVASVTRQIPDLLSQIMLTVDIGASISPRVGIECYPTVTPDRNSDRWLSEFTTWLLAQSLASPDKIAALCSWNGDREYPLQSSDRDRFLGDYDACVMDISHLKLVFDPLTGLQAKAYLLADFKHPDDDKLPQAPRLF
jgi:hypothetical protein